MNPIKLVFNQYIKTMKVITTYIGIFFIYFSSVLLGKIIYLFVAKETHRKWQAYQSGTASDKMF